MSVVASAPGSIMITGEHAVVYGHPAIVCAIEQRITVRVTPTDDGSVTIHSEIAPTVRQNLSDLRPEGPLRFVLHAAAKYRPHIANGLVLNISSEIDPTLGLGSSAAVTVATIAALDAFTKHATPALQQHILALSIVRHIQGRGSGADLAASLFGGSIAYQLPTPLLTGVPKITGAVAEITNLPKLPALGLKYAGYKTPTAEVLSRIADKMRGQEALFDRLYDRMGASATEAIDAAKREDWATVAQSLTDYQALMAELGVSDPTLDRIVASAKGAMAAKISGSGLGDCVVAFGAVPQGFQPAEQAIEGVILHD